MSLPSSNHHEQLRQLGDEFFDAVRGSDPFNATMLGIESRLGAAFDVRGFHGAVLSNGAVPLDVLQIVVVDRWVHDVSS